ncbi:Transcriptional regulator DauR [bioreactor metagenome]|uniref:Transcriptional regulator DauR n=1 Tax=bioreactor metagenome TaxID=1076179 RepID=A0A644TNY5_9ZZZZ
MNEIHPNLKIYISVANTVQATVGPHCEVILHDLSHPEHSIIYIAGNITNRQVGAPVTDLVLGQLRHHGDDCADIINYLTATNDGKTLRSSTMFIRNASQEIIGCLCINIDITVMLSLKDFLENNLSIEHTSNTENFTNNVSEVINNIIKSTLDHYHIPVIILPKEEKLTIVRQLDSKGIFLVKGSVELVASTLGVSRYSIYNYLDEVRGQKQHKVRLDSDGVLTPPES